MPAEPSPPPPPVPGDPHRRATLLAILCPGAGHALGRGEPVSGVAHLALVVLLALSAAADPRLWGFVAAAWLYQVADARRGSAMAAPAGVAAAPARHASWLLVVAGLVLLSLTASSFRPRPSLLVPVVLIAAGVRLLYTYFRADDGAPAT